MIRPKEFIVYTSIFGGKDRLRRQPEYRDTRYICITDDPDLKGSGWEVRVEKPASTTDPRRSSRHPKFMPHLYFPEYKRSLYIDGNMEMVSDLTKVKFDTICLFHHISRAPYNKKDLYDEIRHCVTLGKDDAELLKKQGESYRKDGHPPGYGLFGGAAILRRHNEPEIIELGRLWWRELNMFSSRDQVSLPYCLWKLGIMPDAIPQDRMWLKKYNHML